MREGCRGRREAEGGRVVINRYLNRTRDPGILWGKDYCILRFHVRWVETMVWDSRSMDDYPKEKIFLTSGVVPGPDELVGRPLWYVKRQERRGTGHSIVSSS